MRNTIQKQKIEMANEVIDAGRFDMQTTNEERKQTLENLLADEDRYKLHTNEVPSLKELNRMIGRGEEEIVIFDRLDEEYQWPRDLLSIAESPPWVLFTEDQILEAIRGNPLCLICKLSNKICLLALQVFVSYLLWHPFSSQSLWHNLYLTC